MRRTKYFLVVLLAIVALVSSGGSAGQVKKKASSSKEKVVLTKKIKTATKVKATESSQVKTEVKSEVKNETPAASATTAPVTGEIVKWQVVSNGGTNSSSTNFGLLGVMSQTSVGLRSSANFGLNSGFWQDFGGTCCALPGDADDSGDVDISDATFIVKYVFRGGATPPCCDQADADGRGDVNIGDATHIVKFVFQGGDDPACPSPGNLVCL